ncbi:MAG: response regulator, partial [Treponema sp.]|nr:response regulator [Treponema sp.]
VMHDHLARVGLRTVVASNGQEAVDIVCERMEKDKKPSDLIFEKGMKPFDLIFMDIHMPVMDGLEAASKISALGLETPIIAMTANIMTSDKELYQAIGMHDCVGKPFTSQELWQCLLKYLTPVGQKTVSKSSQTEADRQLQKILRTHFLKQYRAKFIEIVEAIETDDIKLAHRLVHTLRSNAAQLGKQNLQRIAREVEETLKEGKEPVTERQLRFLEAELKVVLEEFSLMVVETDNSTLSVALTTEEALELAKQMEPLLKSGNPECLKFINRISTIPGSEELVRQMEEFDFEAALSTLTELKEGWM